ncbi:hypothetical protein CPB85DRAFT_1491863 [Mucidula mucida]|nr:hypothetical protein CPB85DRAFT_1491863 [Mucidula mucida]
MAVMLRKQDGKMFYLPTSDPAKRTQRRVSRVRDDRRDLSPFSLHPTMVAPEFSVDTKAMHRVAHYRIDLQLDIQKISLARIQITGFSSVCPTCHLAYFTSDSSDPPALSSNVPCPEILPSRLVLHDRKDIDTTLAEIASNPPATPEADMARPFIDIPPTHAPADVYYNILRRIKDLTFLWTACRVVSREFRDAVDLVFIRHHLPQTYLAVDTDSNLSFDGLDPTDPTIAIFKDKDCSANLRPKLIRRLKDKFDKYGNTFSELFAEEKAYKRVTRDILEAAKPSIDAVRDQSFEVAMVFVLATFDSHVEIARRQVRDRRIKPYSKGYKRVTAARNELGWLEFSDSEEDEERREEAEDEDDDSDDDEEGDEDSDDDEEGEENDDDEEEEHDDEQASEQDSEDSDAGRRTKRRTEGRTTRARRSKSLPADQSTGRVQRRRVSRSRSRLLPGSSTLRLSRPVTEEIWVKGVKKQCSPLTPHHALEKSTQSWGTVEAFEDVVELLRKSPALRDLARQPRLNGQDQLWALFDFGLKSGSDNGDNGSEQASLGSQQSLMTLNRRNHWTEDKGVHITCHVAAVAHISKCAQGMTTREIRITGLSYAQRAIVPISPPARRILLRCPSFHVQTFWVTSRVGNGNGDNGSEQASLGAQQSPMTLNRRNH